jgi:uroporphyrinogen-III decarboxylase
MPRQSRFCRHNQFNVLHERLLLLLISGFPPVLQGNVDPTVLFCGEAAIEAAVRDVLSKAGGRGHILNLGHGVLVGTPEEAVAHMFNLSKQIKAAELVTA